MTCDCPEEHRDGCREMAEVEWVYLVSVIRKGADTQHTRLYRPIYGNEVEESCSGSLLFKTHKQESPPCRWMYGERLNGK